MMQCEHIHGDGTRCLSPSLHRRSFCYMHWRQREHKLAVPPEPEFQLPSIDSEASVVLASNQIAHAVLAGKLDTKKARVVLACLKIAVDSLRRQQDVSGVSECELTPAMEQELARPGTEINMGLEKDNVGTGVLARGPQQAKRDGVVARAGGAKAPRSLAASQETAPPAAHNDLSSQAERSEARNLVFGRMTDEDLERFIDQHPLMKLKPPTLAEITGSV